VTLWGTGKTLRSQCRRSSLSRASERSLGLLRSVSFAPPPRSNSAAIAALLMAITPAPRRPASATPTWEEAGSVSPVGSLGTRSRRAERSRVFERVHGRRDLGLATQGTRRFRSSVDPTPICFPQPLLRLSTSFPLFPPTTYRDLSIALLLKHQNFAYLPVAAITASHLLGIVTSRSSSSCHPTAFQAC
jgi:hypothetical protein